MKAKSVLVAAAATLAAAFSTGCMSMMLAGAPTTRSFDDPPVRETVDPYPKESLCGKWEASGKMNMFIDGRRVVVYDVSDELVLNEDGTCSHTETQTIAENTLGASYGGGGSQEMQVVSEGTWSYENDVLTMKLSTDGRTRFGGTKKVDFTWIYTVKWHSDEEFSLVATDEQFKANAQSSGSGLGWDTRTLEPNGVEVLKKKGIPLMSPSQEIVGYADPYKRVGDAD